MKKNVGTLDTGVRMVIATICAITAFTRQTQDGIFWILLLVGLVALITSMVHYCPLYTLFGINTREKE